MPVQGKVPAVLRSKVPLLRDLHLQRWEIERYQGSLEERINAAIADLQRAKDVHTTKPINPDDLFHVLVGCINPGNRKARHTPLSQPAVRRAMEAFQSVELPGISLESGMFYCNCDEDLYREMLAKFLETKAGTTAEIRTEMEKGDMEAAARIAHSMRSIAASIGAGGLSKAAAGLEKAIDKGEPDSWGDPLETFDHHLGVVICGLEGHLRRETGEEPPVGDGHIDRKAVKGLLDEMCLVLDSDVGRVMRLLKDLRKHLRESRVAREFAQLERKLDEFNIAAARVKLLELAKTLGMAKEELP